MLEVHDPQWEENARNTIFLLESLCGDIAVDIQHVGSTAIRGIVARPIIDIVVGVNDVNQVLLKNVFEKNGVFFRKQDVEGQLLYVMGDMENEVRTHHIHVVRYGNTAWRNYIDFRDYLNYDRKNGRGVFQIKD